MLLEPCVAPPVIAFAVPVLGEVTEPKTTKPEPPSLLLNPERIVDSVPEPRSVTLLGITIWLLMRNVPAERSTKCPEPHELSAL